MYINEKLGYLGIIKLAVTTIEQNHQLATTKGRFFIFLDRYRQLVWRLIYLTIVIPELAYCVHVLTQFMHQSRQEHWVVALQVVYILSLVRAKEFFLVHPTLFI